MEFIQGVIKRQIYFFSFMKSLKSVLQEKLPPLPNTGVDNDAHTIVHIHYEVPVFVDLFQLQLMKY